MTVWAIVCVLGLLSVCVKLCRLNTKRRRKREIVIEGERVPVIDLWPPGKGER